MCAAAVWIGERRQALFDAVMDGKTYRQIGAELGCSRSAVIGAARRCGIDPAAYVRASPRPLPAPPDAARRPKRMRTRAKQHRPPAPVPEPAPRPAPQPEAERVGVRLTDARLGQCRYVLGEAAGAATRFCGEPVLFGTSWCREHAQRVFTPAATGRLCAGRRR